MKLLSFAAVMISAVVMQIQSYAQEAKRDLDENTLIIVEAKIRPGQFENFVKTAKEMSAMVKSNEAGAFDYEWTITPDSSTCFILERYASPEATMTHSKIFREQYAEKFGAVLEFVGMTVYGKSSNELKAAFGPAGANSRVKIAGFAR